MTYPQPSVPESLPKSLRVRSRFDEIVDVAVTVSYAVMGVCIWYVLMFGPDKFHDTPAVELISGLGVHWGYLASTFLLYALLLAIPKAGRGARRWTRLAGWAVGLFAFAFYFASLVHAVVIGTEISALAGGAALAAVISHVRAVLTTISAIVWGADA